MEVIYNRAKMLDLEVANNITVFPVGKWGTTYSVLGQMAWGYENVFWRDRNLFILFSAFLLKNNWTTVEQLKNSS